MVSQKSASKILKSILLSIGVLAVLLTGFAAHTQTAAAAENPSYDKVYKEAKKHLGKSYVYGATGPTHFDCSGFTKYVFNKSISKKIPRTAQAQYNKTKKVAKKNVKKGDLVYFGSSKNSISHVGLYIGNGKMIDSQNRGVVTEKIYAPWWHVVGFSRPTTLATD